MEMVNRVFEYSIVMVPRGGLTMTEERLNELGKAGYELVYVNTPGTQWIFKRPKKVTRTAAKKAVAK